MIARWSPRTLLLAVLAGWAFVAALAAAAGLGGRYRLHDADATLAPPLPELSLTASAQRLGPLSDYPEAAARPLFAPDRRPAPVLIAEGESTETPLNITLTSVLLTDAVSLALVRDNDSGKTLRARLGEPLEGHPAWRLAELQPRLAVFEGPSGRMEAELRVFDGSGGETPTALGAVAPAQPQPSRTVPSAPTGAIPAAGNGVAGEPAAEATPEQQAEAIRQRIEARRAQLREQAARRQQRQEE